jgi:hypothetical protein
VGCSCPVPCRYREAWTLGGRVGDRLAYLGLLGVNPRLRDEVQVGKDIDRTYGDNPTFGRNPRFREMLREVLLRYSVYDQEVGYVQGMNLIAANLLYHVKQTELTFWSLVDLMEHTELRLVFAGSLHALRWHCERVDAMLATSLPLLHHHMIALGIDSRCFLDGWLLSLMSKVVPLEQMHLVLHAFRQHGWAFLYRLAVGLLETLADCLLLTDDEPEFLMALSGDSCRELGVEWSRVVDGALK